MSRTTLFIPWFTECGDIASGAKPKLWVRPADTDSKLIFLGLVDDVISVEPGGLAGPEQQDPAYKYKAGQTFFKLMRTGTVAQLGAATTVRLNFSWSGKKVAWKARSITLEKADTSNIE